MPTPVTLNVYRGEDLVRTERFTREIIKIGRLSSAHLCLEDDRVSRIHSVIEVAPDGHISIIDMGSAEGTFVNGKRVSKRALKAGDEIRVGGLRIVFHGEDERTPGASNHVPLGRAPAASAPHVGGNGHATNGRALANGRTHAHANGHATSLGRDGRAPLLAYAGDARPLELRGAPISFAVASGAAAERVPIAPLDAPPRGPRPPLAVARPIDEEPVEAGAPELGVELRIVWGETLLDAATFVAPKAPVLVGESPRCRFRLSGPALPSDEFPVLRLDADEYRFAFARGMGGGVEENGATRTFDDLVRSRVATPDDVDGVFSVSVPRAGAVRAELGSGLRIEARYRRPPRPAIAAWWEKLDYRYLELVLVLLFVLGGFIVAAKTTPRGVDVVQDDLPKAHDTLARFVVPPEPQRKRDPYVEKLKADAKKDPGELAERHRNEEGKMGKRDAPRNDHRSAPRAIDPDAKELVKSSGLLAAIGKAKGVAGLSTVMGQGGLGGDLKGAIGNMFGPVVGDSWGVGGLGLKGTGTGGGGGGDTIGIGAVGTKGRGGGLGGYGTGVGGLGTKRDRPIAIAAGDTRVLGAIDQELVRKVIRDHADQVRYCYEQQLTLTPKLAGKLAIKWQINADGFASATMVDPANPVESDAMGRVAGCVMGRIRTWEFPKPKGGGIAIVTYPWILRTAGSTTSS